MLVCQKMFKQIFLNLFIVLTLYYSVFADPIASAEDESDSSLYIIEGRVFPLSDFQNTQSNWPANTRIHVNGGEYVGFVRKDGTFVVHNIPSGSYIVEVLNPEYSFEPVRVEINSKGKYRARKVNHIQTSQIVQVPYPLKIKALGKTRYFQQREQWRITDLLFNPMIMMTVLPLLLFMVLPKLLNDPETKKEMEQLQNLTKFEMPEMSEIVSNLLGNNPQQPPSTNSGQSNKKAQKAKKRQ